MSGLDSPVSRVTDATVPLPGEFYFDGPYMVFTAAYHLRRGSCCHSDCRHCPYKNSETAEASEQKH